MRVPRYKRDVFSAQLRRSMRYYGLTQRDLAASSGISTSTISNYVSGITFPRPETYFRVLNGLERSLVGEGTLDKKITYNLTRIKEQAGKLYNTLTHDQKCLFDFATSPSFKSNGERAKQGMLGLTG